MKKWIAVLLLLFLLISRFGIARADGGDMPVTQYEPVWRVVCADYLNIRGGPYIDASIYGYLERDDRVLVHEWWNGWGMIEAGRWVRSVWLCSE